MRLVKSSNLANTPVFKTITWRQFVVWVIVIVAGIGLWVTPLFNWNLFAMLAYAALVFLLVGQTPTHRSIIRHMYGIVFKKPIRTVVSDQSTTTTVSHSIKEVRLQDRINEPVFLMNDGHVSLVYNVTSGINKWSNDLDKKRQTELMRVLFNNLDPHERLFLILKNDSDTGMLQLAEELKLRENFEGDDLQKQSDIRQSLLMNAGDEGSTQTLQQYAVLQVKEGNISRAYDRLKDTARIIRPASKPLDILLSAMGLEGGIVYNDFISEEE